MPPPIMGVSMSLFFLTEFIEEFRIPLSQPFLIHCISHVCTRYICTYCRLLRRPIPYRVFNTLRLGRSVLEQPYLNNIRIEHLTIGDKRKFTGRSVLEQPYLNNIRIEHLTIGDKRKFTGRSVLEQPYLNNKRIEHLTIGDKRKFTEMVIAP
jgi:hypothetical protein